MDKLERLLNLTAALLNADRVLSAEELQKRVGGYPDSKSSFRRAFERDKEDLRNMGIPLRVESVPGVDPPVDGYRILRSEYRGRDLQLTPEELAALHLASNLVRLDGDDTGLLKLGGSTTEVDTHELGYVPFDNNLAALIAAAAKRLAVSFGYSDKQRKVEPWRLSFSRGNWYLSAWDRDRKAKRLFRVDRIAGPVKQLNQATQPLGTSTDPNSLRGWELTPEDNTTEDSTITVRVAVDADQAAYLHYLIGKDAKPDEQTGTVEIEVRNIEAFRGFMLTFLDHAEVLDPPQVRQDMVSWLKALT